MTNIAEILENAPKGIELYSPLFGEVKFVEVGVNNDKIFIEQSDGTEYSFYENGRAYNIANGECLLFPSKEHRTWDDWQNVLFPKSNGYVVYCDNSLCLITKDGLVHPNNTTSSFDSLIGKINFLTGYRYATPEQTKRFFKDLKENGFEKRGRIITEINPDKFGVGNILKNCYEGTLVLCLGGRKAVTDNNDELTIRRPDDWLIANENGHDCFFEALLDNGYFYDNEENAVKKIVPDDAIDAAVRKFKDSLSPTCDNPRSLTNIFRGGLEVGIKMSFKQNMIGNGCSY